MEAKCNPRFAAWCAQKRSLIFQAIALDIIQAAESSINDVVLLEHGLVYAINYETIWLAVPEYALEPYFGNVQEPDMVIYLDVPLEELLVRGAGRASRNSKKMEAVRNSLAACYQQNPHWVYVDGTQTREKVFESAWEHVSRCVENHLQGNSLPRRDFLWGS